MSFGLGDGPSFGGDSPTAGNTSEVGGSAVVYEFGDEADAAPFPGQWEHYIRSDDGAGSVSYDEEPAVATYFSVLDGLGLFNYTRTPVSGAPFVEQGYGASPLGSLNGRNASIQALVVSPTEVQDPSADSFVWRVTLGLRWVVETGTFVGARARAEWDSGSGWTTPMALEIVQASGGVISVVATATLPDVDVLDIWRTNPLKELAVEVRGTEVTATLAGVVEVTGQVPADGPPRPVVFIEASNTTGSTITPVPSLSALRLKSLRDLERLGPAPQIPGSVELEYGSPDALQLPIRTLLEDDAVKRIGGRRFRFTEDTTVQIDSAAVGRFSYLFRQGEVIRLLEALGTQQFIRAVRDLNYERGKKKSLA